MQPRDTPRIIPGSTPMLVVDMNGSDHHFRVPPPHAGLELMQEFGTPQIAALLALGSQLDESDPMTVFGTIQSAGPSLLYIIGALIGDSWRHRHMDLEAVRDGDTAAFGRAVLEELHDSGYDLNWIVLLAIKLSKEIVAQSNVDLEAVKRLGFSSPPGERATSSSSTSGFNTSETPGDTPN